jgi:hypothetical protein
MMCDGSEKITAIPLPNHVKLTRQEAALRQIVEAIHFFRVGRYECAITLAGAAEDMLPRRDNSAFSVLRQMQAPHTVSDSIFGKASPDERGRILNDVRNWLKHNDREPDEREIYRHDAELMIVRAITKIDPLMLNLMILPAWAREPWDWFSTHIRAT